MLDLSCGAFYACLFGWRDAVASRLDCAIRALSSSLGHHRPSGA